MSCRYECAVAHFVLQVIWEFRLVVQVMHDWMCKEIGDCISQGWISWVCYFQECYLCYILQMARKHGFCNSCLHICIWRYFYIRCFISHLWISWKSVLVQSTPSTSVVSQWWSPPFSYPISTTLFHLDSEFTCIIHVPSLPPQLLSLAVWILQVTIAVMEDWEWGYHEWYASICLWQQSCWKFGENLLTCIPTMSCS